MKLYKLLVSQIVVGSMFFACRPKPEMNAVSNAPSAVDAQADHGPDPDSISPEKLGKVHADPSDTTALPASEGDAGDQSDKSATGVKPAEPVAEKPAADGKTNDKPAVNPPVSVPAPKASPTPAPKASPAPAPAPKVTPPPAPAPAQVPVPAPAPAGGDQAKFQAMLKAGEVLSTYDVTTYQGWGTAQNRIEVAIAVDNNGKAIMIQRPTASQVVSSADGKKDGSFGTGLHSALRVCNKSNKPIYMHSGNGAPFQHADNPIRIGDCAKFLVRNADKVRDGASYDHAAGNAKENFILFKIKKIKPDGSVMP